MMAVSAVVLRLVAPGEFKLRERGWSLTVLIDDCSSQLVRCTTTGSYSARHYLNLPDSMTEGGKKKGVGKTN